MRAVAETSDTALPQTRRNGAGRPFDRAAFQLPIVPEKRLVPVFEFSTLDLPPREQFIAWRDSYASIVDLLTADSPPVAFEGKQVLWDLGDMAFCQVRTEGLAFACRAERTGRQSIDHWVISLMLKGELKTITPSKVFKSQPGSVQVHALGKPFGGHIGDSEMLQLFLPRDFFRGKGNLLEAAEFSTIDNGMAVFFADYMTNLARRLPLFDVNDLPHLAAAIRAMVLACIAPSAEHLDEADDAIADVLMQRARRFVQANLFSTGLGALSLQRELGLSRSRLYRLFEPYGGVVRYIQHRRLMDAHAALADPDDLRGIADIAEERGFTDGAGFSRAFKREFGYSPREVRTTHGRSAADRSDAGLAAIAPRDRLDALLRRLQA